VHAGPGLDDDALLAYLRRIDLPLAAATPRTLQQAHVQAIAYENLDVRLGRTISLDLPDLVAKLVTGGRGGYCYEQNTLMAGALEALGHRVTRCLGRVRLSDPVAPRPATHMVLLVDDHVVDVGFGTANPVVPIPLGGEASFGGCTWRTERVVAPEGDEVWQLALGDLAMYTFSDEPRHPVDYLTPNHWSSTHPLSLFTQVSMAHRWVGDVHLALAERELRERFPDGRSRTTVVPPEDHGRVLRERFGIDLPRADVDRLLALGG
jgi:N-hydroxyarylamine O-acetyltransferase